MFEMLIFGLGIFELKFATLEPELAILLGIFESELGIFGLKLATLESLNLQYYLVYLSLSMLY